jgi:hypothetical protein
MDLSTTYLGLKLRTPLVPSASPLSEGLDKIKQMEQAGAAAARHLEDGFATPGRLPKPALMQSS